MNHLVVDTHEVAAALGYTVDSVRSAQHNKNPTVPPADGRVGSNLYWLRSTLDAWVAQPRKRPALRPDKPRRKGSEETEFPR